MASLVGESMHVKYQEDLNKKEQDPNGVGQHDAGAKLDQGKPMAGLVLGGFALALMDVSKVGTFGATKYRPNGWKEVEGGEQRYMDAGVRHLLQDLAGIEIDDDSGCPHISQAVWNLLAVIEFRKKNEEV